tara:strand:- start:1266 stop:1502 length:237 start_codon:yes stop_codon:yes gene_type:complete
MNNIKEALKLNKPKLDNGLTWIKNQISYGNDSFDVITTPTRRELHSLVKEAAQLHEVDADLMVRVAESNIVHMIPFNG